MKQLPFLHDAAGRRGAVDSSMTTATPAATTPAVADQRRPAIIVPVQVTAPEEIARQCSAIADTGVVDVIEWRIDPVIASIAHGRSGGCGAADSQALAEAVLGLAGHVSGAGLPVLITLRTKFEGGTADVSEDVYTEILTTVSAGLSESSGLSEVSGLSVPTAAVTWALDVEIERRGAAELIDTAHGQGLAVVASHHNFAGTDSAEVLEATFTTMAAAGADVAKIAMMPTTRGDVADLLRATALAEEALEIPVLGISMGQLGRTSRVMGADFGSCATFAQLGESSAPGQIAVADLAGIVDRLYG
ncbi:MAG: type I 3-dehydroquinate dehydratase [Brevibacterium sp.]|nr:type I 3-dehydroquinate dehydratase [Brevibacterium sp.]MDN5832499.1 type I 3-dehydroquinate dehydratase [Brevibacterium sp.]MDN5875147.1 type I 3-dehydroquinate dehydratase [Brevibacterium sp.]MDN5908280.1 type I 3-dehydroquinate dehydratase [Brevibacterium sp.]MDN6156662.1 type I 3-dehydroquinate dehydratase [Brevibacterium sp.]